MCVRVSCVVVTLPVNANVHSDTMCTNSFSTICLFGRPLASQQALKFKCSSKHAIELFPNEIFHESAAPAIQTCMYLELWQKEMSFAHVKLRINPMKPAARE